MVSAVQYIQYKLRADVNVELQRVNAAVLKDKSTAPRMLCLARYTTQPAFGSSYESLVSLCLSHIFPSLAALRCHINGNLFQCVSR